MPRNFATAICSGRGAHAPTWPRMSRMRAVIGGGATVQPTRKPVAANAFEIPSTKIVYGVASGTSCGGLKCRDAPKVSIQ